MVCDYNVRLDRDFDGAISANTDTSKQSAVCAIYHFFRNSLFGCLTALGQLSESR